MVGWSKSYGSGRVISGELEVIYRPRVNRGYRGVVMTHGAGGGADYWNSTTNFRRIADGLAKQGFAMISAEWADDSWGNAAASATVETARLKFAEWGCQSDKVLVCAASMGFLTGFGYARDYAKVAAIAAVMPAADLNEIRVNNPFGVRTGIDAAWGSTYPAALPAGADPSDYPASLVGVPTTMFYSPGDTVCTPASITGLAALIGGTAVALDTAVQHSDAVAATLTAQQMVDALWPYRV